MHAAPVNPLVARVTSDLGCGYTDGEGCYMNGERLSDLSMCNPLPGCVLSDLGSREDPWQRVVVGATVRSKQSG